MHHSLYIENLEELGFWLKCYKEFEISYKDLVSKFPPPPIHPPEEVKSFFGIPTPKSMAIERQLREDKRVWEKSFGMKLAKLVDKYIGEYGKHFCFRIIGEHFHPNYLQREYLEILDGVTVRWLSSYDSLRVPGISGNETIIQKQRSSLEESLKKRRSTIRRRELESTKQEREARKLKKQRQDKALVAAAAGKSRNLSSSIKRKLRVNHPCPYCGGPLGTDYHADHIYPISKGGLSTIQNMVNVCSSCNLAKKDQTLGIFIRKHNLCRDEIESRLMNLDKEF